MKDHSMKETTSAVIRRPQRTLTPAEHEIVWSTALLNLHGGLIMGIIDPVPNLSPMSEDEGAWVRAQVWPRFLTEIDDKYPFGFWRWSMCERGTCWNCLSRRCDLCVHRQEGGPHVDGNVEWVHNARGRCVAKLLIRSDDAPCVWWCRCPCPKDGPLASEPETPPTSADTAGRPDGGAERGSRRVEGACEPADEAQDTLF
ncbi:DUF6248 family natural product biosynthesis protein [Streptomyces sp. NPDC002952]|uniref:DUF6248 family natural product biosynthesis protein n=1 Tax=Streptomyces sp. NPDC002952 TaxID=3364673 RepID=UPI0036A79720